MTETDFSHTTRDSNGYLPPLDLVGAQFRHTGNRHIYSIQGFCWIGDTDEWGIVHRRDGCVVTFVRSQKNFFGNRSNGEVRFQRV